MQHLHIYGLLDQHKKVAPDRKKQELETRLHQHQQLLPHGDLEQDEEQEREKTGECADLKVRFKFALNIFLDKVQDVSKSLLTSGQE